MKEVGNHHAASPYQRNDRVAGGFDLSALLGGGGGGFGGAAPQPVADPETAYASQLTQLQVHMLPVLTHCSGALTAVLVPVCTSSLQRQKCAGNLLLVSVAGYFMMMMILLSIQSHAVLFTMLLTGLGDSTTRCCVK